MALASLCLFDVKIIRGVSVHNIDTHPTEMKKGVVVETKEFIASRLDDKVRD